MTVREHPAARAGAPIDWSGLARILVVRPDNLGDVLLLGPALRALRRAAPAATLDLLAAPAGAAAAPLLPEVDRVLTASVSWQQLDPDRISVDADRGLVARLAAADYQAVLIFTSFAQSPWPAAYLCRWAGVPVRVGMSKEFGGAGLTHWVPSPSDQLHQVDRALYLLEQVGVAPDDTQLRARVPQTVSRATRHLRAVVGLPERYAVVLPGASCAARRYPADRLARVVALLERDGLVAAVAGTASEQPLIKQVAEAAPGAVGLAGRLSVPELAALVADSAVVVCNNSGGAHLAEATGTPAVVLFSGTERVAEFAPRHTRAAVLTMPTECSPCRQFTCPYQLECLDVPPATVAAKAVQLARAWGMLTVRPEVVTST